VVSSGTLPLPLPARVVRGVGKAASWLILFMVLITFVVVLLRYGFNLGWVWLQESVTYLHAAVFMLAAAWTWQEDGHVRVDILYRERSPRFRAWVNLVGTLLFLVPVCLYLLIIGWDYVAASWALREGSRQAGGLPLVYLLKSLILALPLLLLLQAACEIPEQLRGLRRLPEPVSPP
jgi:TRAP-type mannitol/chloroaromatic compound transport system permease small subunit